MKTKILIASKNKGKIKEIKSKLNALNKGFISLDDINKNIETPVEDGDTFYENALIKAQYYFNNTGYTCLADDSGLVVNCLKGKPGVHSARYAGENATDKENNTKLISMLDNAIDRSARFVCSMVLYFSEQKIITGYGEVHGEIVLVPRGNKGFGYDPLFYLPKLGKTMAELEILKKNRISHRAKALDDLFNKLKAL